MKNKIISFYKKNKKVILLILRIVISISLIAYLVKTQFKNFSSIVEILKSSNKILIVLAVSTHIFGVWITAFRWKSLLDTQNVKLSTAKLSVTVLIGLFFNNVLPTIIGGDVFRTYDASKKAKIPLSSSASVILVERFSGVASSAIYAVAALFLGFTAIGNQPVIIPIVIFFVIVVIIAIIIVKPSILGIDRFLEKFKFVNRIKEKLSSAYNTLTSFKNHRIVLLKVLIYSFLLQFSVILNWYLSAKALGIDLGLTAFIFMVPVVSTIAMIPISIGGIGLREGSLVFIMVAMGVANEKAAMCSLLILFALLIVGIVGGIVYMVRPYFEGRSGEIAGKDIKN
ncbi:MAG: lysylphosphatidylglycerol synthase transmembrane domain-containing protein [Actinomycetota bacterium]|nr:lysylphosphatidylglycerol synthase transmembrane domain-containing protein [Actinomycetota bacterium]